MRRNPLLERAREALKNPDRRATETLLDSISLTLREREVVVKSEIDGWTLEAICNSFAHWGRKSVCSYVHMVRIKKHGMEKIGRYLAARNDNKTIEKR